VEAKEEVKVEAKEEVKVEIKTEGPILRFLIFF
jgi:hypothetical protein